MKRCPRCGEEKPLEGFYVDRRAKTGRTSYCKVCHRAAQKTYFVDTDRRRAREREYRKDPEYRAKSDQYTRDWIARNRERFLAKKKEYREANKERIAEAWSVWYEANREVIARRNREYAKTNPEAKARGERKRRARRAAVESDDHTRREIFDRDGGHCVACERALDFDEPRGFHIDHIVPISLGGPDIRANVQLMCPGCNRAKWATLEGQLHFAA